MTFQKHCPGCFAYKDAAAVCPVCGYDESSPLSPLYLPHGLILADQYRVGRVLGRPGGFGITYLCWDIHLQQRMAVKEFLPRALATRGPDGLTVTVNGPAEAPAVATGREQFLQEARIAARLNHPNVVRVRSYFNANGTAYLVMDYHEGRSLGDHLAEIAPRMSADTAIRLLQPVLNGLAYIHDSGVVHRDVKPHNIYLTHQGAPILLDFGAARPSSTDKADAPSVVVTEGYAPLEQYQRDTPQGPWTDIYGVAATLYRMLVGVAPPIALDRLGNDPLVTGDWAGLPAGLSPIMARALAPHPEDRYALIEEFAQDLQHWLDGNPELARQAPEVRAPGAGAAADAPTVMRDTTQTQPRTGIPTPRRRASDRAPSTSEPVLTAAPTAPRTLPQPPPPRPRWGLRLLVLLGVMMLGFAAGFAVSL